MVLDQLSLNAVKSIAECSKRAECGSKVLQNAPREHSAILSTCIKLPSVSKTFVLSIFEWEFYRGFAVFALLVPLANLFYYISRELKKAAGGEEEEEEDEEVEEEEVEEEETEEEDDDEEDEEEEEEGETEKKKTEGEEDDEEDEEETLETPKAKKGTGQSRYCPPIGVHESHLRFKQDAHS